MKKRKHTGPLGFLNRHKRAVTALIVLGMVLWLVFAVIVLMLRDGPMP